MGGRNDDCTIDNESLSFWGMAMVHCPRIGSTSSNCSLPLLLGSDAVSGDPSVGNFFEGAFDTLTGVCPVNFVGMEGL